jgi:hypothetical protein
MSLAKTPRVEKPAAETRARSMPREREEFERMTLRLGDQELLSKTAAPRS